MKANGKFIFNFVKLDDEWPESIFHHVGSQSVSYVLSVPCEVFKSSELRQCVGLCM